MSTPIVIPDLSKFARDGEVISARNTQGNIVVHTFKSSSGDDPIEFQAKGDPDGGDVQEISSLYLKQAPFRKALNQGIFEIVDADDSAVIEAFRASKAAWDRQTAAKAEPDRFDQLNAVKNLSGEQCAHKDGKIQCPHYSKTVDARNKVPLCSIHESEAGQYVPEETGQFDDDNKPLVRWIKVGLQRG